jgi:PAS domain S-box-containing protein
MPKTETVSAEEAVVAEREQNDPRPPSQNYPKPDAERVRDLLMRYGNAVLSVVLMTLLRFALSGVFGQKYPYLTLFIAIAFTGWFGGIGPAILAVFLSSVLAAYLFLQPGHVLYVRDPADQFGLAMFALEGLAIGFITHVQRLREHQAKSGELERRRSEEILATTLRSIGDGVIATDAYGRVSFMNAIAERLTGWEEAQAKSRPLEDVFNIVNEKTRQRVENPVDKVIQSGGIVGLANHTVLISRDGIERAIDDSGAPIRSVWGLQGAVLVFRDVTEQRRAHEAHTKLAAIIKSSDDVIIGKTLDGIITSWNPAAERTYGYSEEEAIGRPVSMLIPPDHPDELPGILSRLRAGEHTERLETKRVRKDGTVLDVALTISPIRDEYGEIIGASTIARDISERKRIAAEADRNRLLFERIAEATPGIL